MNRCSITATALAIGIAAAGCSGGSDQSTSTLDRTITTSSTPTVDATPAATPTTGASNLFLTPAIRRALIHARAQAIGLRDSAFVRLYKGSSFYALDHNTGTYWAAGSLVASRKSLKAQVYTQDEGAYTIFVLRPGGEWQIYDAGRDGPEARSGAQCPIKIPADVLKVWHWAPNTCDPPLSTEGN